LTLIPDQSQIIGHRSACGTIVNPACCAPFLRTSVCGGRIGQGTLRVIRDDEVLVEAAAGMAHDEYVSTELAAQSTIANESLRIAGAKVTQPIPCYGVPQSHSSQRWAGFLIGLAVVSEIFVIRPFTGGSVNPARTIGPYLANALSGGRKPWGELWIYVAGPVVGAVLAAFVVTGWYSHLRPPPTTRSWSPRPVMRHQVRANRATGPRRFRQQPAEPWWCICRREVVRHVDRRHMHVRHVNTCVGGVDP
jgi:hypothetical protein